MGDYKNGSFWWDTKSGRAIIFTAVLGGLGGNVGLLTKDTDDRFKGADFKAQMAPRDEAIRELRRDVYELQREFSIHLSHSAKYTEKINADAIVTEELKRIQEQDKRDLIEHLREDH